MLKHAAPTGPEQVHVSPVSLPVLIISHTPGLTAAYSGSPTMPGGPTLSILRWMIYPATVNKRRQTTSGRSGNPATVTGKIIRIAIIIVINRLSQPSVSNIEIPPINK